MLEESVELAVSLPGLRAMRSRSSSLHTGVKEHHGIGRIERGATEWWGAGRVWRSSPGCVLVKQPGDVVRHLAHRDAETVFTAVVLPASEVEQVRSEGVAVAPAQLEPADPRAAPFHRLLDAVDAGADRLALEVALTEALHALVRISTARPDHSRAVRRALDYLRGKLAEPVSLDDLARHASLDKFHLCRAFRAQVGMPPHAYLTHLRIARAKRLLERGVRAADVAPLVGLYDQAQLTRHFRRVVGTTPARYARSTSAAGTADRAVGGTSGAVEQAAGHRADPRA